MLTMFVKCARAQMKSLGVERESDWFSDRVSSFGGNIIIIAKMTWGRSDLATVSIIVY